MKHDRPEEEVEAAYDLARLRERVSYVRHAVRRHPGVTAGVAALTLLGAAFLAWALPDRYEVEARLIVHQDDLIAALSNPGRPQFDAEANPVSKAVSDMALRRDNLLSIISQTNLLQHWRATRAPLFQLKDWIVFRHRLSDEQLTEVLVGTLEKRITVTAEPGDVITFDVVWVDPGMAEEITETVMSNFIKDRDTNEMALLGETIALLEGRLREADKAMNDALSSARSLERPARPVAGSEPAAARLVETVELARIHSNITKKRRAIDDLVGLKERRVADLQVQLAEQQVLYSDTNPAIVSLRHSIESLSADTPQIIQARKELAALEALYAARGGSPATLEGLPETSPSIGRDSEAATSSLLAALEATSRDPGQEYGRGRLIGAIARYYTIADRLQSARIEREAANADTKFRYTVVKPPLPPRKSTTAAYRTVLVVLGILAAPLLGIAAAAAVELRRARVAHDWQLERLLGLPVLAVLPSVKRRR